MASPSDSLVDSQLLWTLYAKWYVFPFIERHVIIAAAIGGGGGGGNSLNEAAAAAYGAVYCLKESRSMTRGEPQQQ